MKRILLIMIALSVSIIAPAGRKGDCRIISRERNSITFAVDEGLPAPEGPMKYKTSGEVVAGAIAKNAAQEWNDRKVYACSFAEDSLFNFGNDPVFKMFTKAYAEHRPVVLSPDMVWLLICQALSHHISLDPELQRGTIVDFEGMKTLKVYADHGLDSGLIDWKKAVDEYTAMISSSTKGGLAELATTRFSTTGDTEALASRITLMDIVEPYFKYELIRIVCGVPSVTLEGTKSDWKALRKAAGKLSGFGLGWWVEEIDPVLQQFEKAAAGRPEAAFWKNMVMTLKPDEVRGIGCGPRSLSPTEFDGWFVKLFPYDNEGRTPEKVTMGRRMVSETVGVDVLYKEIGGGADKEVPLEFRAGFVGIEEDPVTLALRPKIGWLVHDR